MIRYVGNDICIELSIDPGSNINRAIFDKKIINRMDANGRCASYVRVHNANISQTKPSISSIHAY